MAHESKTQRQIEELRRKRVSTTETDALDAETVTLQDQITALAARTLELEGQQIYGSFTNVISTFFAPFILSPPVDIIIDHLRIGWFGAGGNFTFNLRSHATYLSGAAVDLFSGNQTVNAAGPTLYTPDQNLTVAAGTALWMPVLTVTGTNYGYGYTLRFH